MKKTLSFMLISLVAFSAILPFRCPTSLVRAAGTTMLHDDFESYGVGTFPSPPWQMWFNGKGSSQQKIVDTTYVSPTRSLRLWGQNGWAAVVAKPITVTTDTMDYEVMVRVENLGLAAKNGAIVGFVYKVSGSIWTAWAQVVFDSNGNIKSGTGQVLQSFDLNTWYKIRTVFTLSNRAYSIWVNDVFKGSFTDNNSLDPSHIQAFGLASDHAEQVCYFDDVEVFTGARVFSPIIDGFQFSNNQFNNKMIKSIEEIAADFESSQVAQELPRWSWSLFESAIQAACWAQQGYCGGMVYTADYYFDHPEELGTLGYSCVHDIPITDQETNGHIIYNQWVTQYIEDNYYLKWWLLRLGDDPCGLVSFDMEVEWILNELDKGNTVKLSVFDPSWNQGLEWFKGHAVLAYQYEVSGNDVYLQVYGPNYGNQSGQYYPAKPGVLYSTQSDGGQIIHLTKTTGGHYSIVDWTDSQYKAAFIEGFKITRFGSEEAPTWGLTWVDVLKHAGEILSHIKEFLVEEGVKLLSVKAESPVNLLLTAEEGLRIGYDPNSGTIINEIEGAMYSGTDTEPQTMLVPYSQSKGYTISVSGTGVGSYRITVESTNSSGGTVGTLIYSGSASQGSLNVYTIELQADGTLVPEFPSVLALLLFIMTTLLVVAICKKKKQGAITRPR
jgi:hypothetical protein